MTPQRAEILSLRNTIKRLSCELADALSAFGIQLAKTARARRERDLAREERHQVQLVATARLDELQALEKVNGELHVENLSLRDRVKAAEKIATTLHDENLEFRDRLTVASSARDDLEQLLAERTRELADARSVIDAHKGAMIPRDPSEETPE